MTDIVLRFTSVDGSGWSKTFKTADAARAAVKYQLGAWELGSTYAVSSDGICKVEVKRGGTIRELLSEPKILTRTEMEEIARGNIERHLGDVADGEDSADTLHDEAYTLAFDALHDAGVPDEKAREVAGEIAQRMAQP